MLEVHAALQLRPCRHGTRARSKPARLRTLELYSGWQPSSSVLVMVFPAVALVVLLLLVDCCCTAAAVHIMMAHGSDKSFEVTAFGAKGDGATSRRRDCHSAAPLSL